MQKLTERIFAVGVQNPTLRVFDIIMQTEYGTTYNAYLVKGDQKTALIDGVHARFFDVLMKNLEAAGCQKVDYLVVNHAEPDHSGAIAELLKVFPDMEIVATPGGLKNLEQITNRPDFKRRPAKEPLDLGGVTLQFEAAPMLHWPDTMFTSCPEEKVLFTCDFLGAHYAEAAVTDTEVKYPDRYMHGFTGYYQAIFGPFKPFVLAGLAKVEAFAPAMVCPSHGPVLTETLPKVMELYRTWSQPQPKGRKAAVAYVSAYGCTRTLAEEIAKVLTEGGAEVDLFDLLDRPCPAAAEAVMSADLVFVGTPTINRDALKPVWDLMTSLDAVNTKGKPVGIFGSYGWSGEGVPMISARAKSLNMKVLGEVRAVFVPSEADLQAVRELAAAGLKELG